MGKWNQKMVREGRCCNCGKERDPKSKRYCTACLKKHAEQSLNWAKENKEKVQDSNRKFRPKWRFNNKLKWNGQRKRYNDRTRKYADNHGLRWEPEEENWLWKNRYLPQRELAKRLGRTYAAIRGRLQILRQRNS